MILDGVRPKKNNKNKKTRFKAIVLANAVYVE
jgi:hypothetical protein